MTLEGKRLLITGVITKDSIAFHAAQQAQAAGATVLLSSFGRVRRMTERAAQRLPEPVDVLELDVNNPSDLAALTDELRSRWGGVDGALHAIAYAPEDALGGRFMTAPAAERVGGVSDQRVLVQVPGRGTGAAHGHRRQPRRARLRRLRGLADL